MTKCYFLRKYGEILIWYYWLLEEFIWDKNNNIGLHNII